MPARTKRSDGLSSRRPRALAQAERLIGPARAEADALDPTIWTRLAVTAWRAIMLAVGDVLRARDGSAPREAYDRRRRLREIFLSEEDATCLRHARQPLIVRFYYMVVGLEAKLRDATAGYCSICAEEVQQALRRVEDEVLPLARLLCEEAEPSSKGRKK